MYAPLLKPVEIDDVWAYVRMGLEAVERKNGLPTTIERIYELIQEGSVHLFMCPDGFIIWYIRAHSSGQPVTFWAWITYGEGSDPFYKYEDQVVELARMCGATKMAFQTARKGYPRKLRNDPNWQLVRYEFERDL